MALMVGTFGLSVGYFNKWRLWLVRLDYLSAILINGDYGWHVWIICRLF
jgi:hypothetical protein